MLKIRTEQLEILGDLSKERFRNSAVAYLRKTVPAVCERMTEQHILQSVVHAMTICKSYGFNREVDVFRYLNLMYVYGFGFDCDARYPWASRILRDSSLPPRARLDWLYSHAVYEARRQGVAHG